MVNAPHGSQDIFIVPLTSRRTSLLAGEFVLADWAAAGLHVPTAVKRGLYTAHETLILQRVGRLTQTDAEQVAQSLRQWLGLAEAGQGGTGKKAVPCRYRVSPPNKALHLTARSLVSLLYNGPTKS
ncbi:MAG TPA: hypothetical protein VI542_22790, partial [Candidatus Tectomicrobia bacterium]